MPGIDESPADDEDFWSLTLSLLKKGHEVRFSAPGSSMTPFVRGGETVTVVGCSPETLKFGDIVLYSTTPDALSSYKRLHRFMKRSVMKGNPVLLTKGDALSFLDAPVSPDQVLGKVSSIKKGSWTLDLNQPLGRAINLGFTVFQLWALASWVTHIGCKLTRLFVRSA